MPNFTCCLVGSCPPQADRTSCASLFDLEVCVKATRRRSGLSSQTARPEASETPDRAAPRLHVSSVVLLSRVRRAHAPPVAPPPLVHHAAPPGGGVPPRTH